MFQKIYTFFIDTFQTFLIAAAFFLVIYMFFFRPFQVNGSSMYPTFEDKENILTNLMGYQNVFGYKMTFGKPNRGDVIVFEAPQDNEKEFIKRVIGVPGDRIGLRDGKVYLNDKLLDESQYLDPTVETYGGSFLHEGQTVTVPQDSYYVMGDNRRFSSDSREWGFVKITGITGGSSFLYWPINKAHIIKNPYQN